MYTSWGEGFYLKEKDIGESEMEIKRNIVRIFIAMNVIDFCLLVVLIHQLSHAMIESLQIVCEIGVKQSSISSSLYC